MRAAAVLFFLSLLATGCEAMRTVELGADDGVLPVWYDDTFYRLPDSYAPEEIPDGEYLLESANGGVTLAVDTRSDGSRDVTFHRQAFLMDATTSQFYRDLVGEDAISGINGLDLELLTLDIDGVDQVDAPPELAAGGGHWNGPGSTLSVDDQTLAVLRQKLIAGEEIRVPFTLTFHLTPADFTTLPSRLHMFLELQPTLHVDTLDAI